jgi:hypothetical protein
MLLSSIAEAQGIIGKATDTSWLAKETRKAGLLLSFSGSQVLGGAIEAYLYGQSGIVSGGNYHTAKTLRDIAWLGTGWFSYAEIRDSSIPLWKRSAHIIGSAAIARNAFEWSYKMNRYGNPFDYTEAHNKHALVYVKFKGGIPYDAYLSLGPATGPIVDLTFMTLGTWLISR